MGYCLFLGLFGTKNERVSSTKRGKEELELIAQAQHSLLDSTHIERLLLRLQSSFQSLVSVVEDLLYISIRIDGRTS